jgi:hypothetical protein
MNENIYNLPNEILDLIFTYLSFNKKIFLNKKYYEKNNRLNYIKNYKSFIRDIIRNDYVFVFKFKLIDNMNLWINELNYEYKNVIYHNYIIFILFYCSKYSSNKCKNLILNKLNELGLKKISLKNNKIKYNKWIK